MSVRRALACLVCIAAAVGCSGGDGGETSAQTTARDTGTQQQRDGELNFGQVETVAQGLEVPWALAFAGDDTILVTERPGRIRLIENGRLRPDPVVELDVVAEGEAGLLGIALHPDFPERRLAYVYYTAPDGNRVSRFRVGDDFGFEGEEVLLRVPAGAVHDGGRLAFGPDGLLYVATGDTGQPELAAEVAALAGKLLRITADGAIPADNPFADSPVFSYGHRNPQGFHWDGEGRLYEAEHGPTGEGGLCCHDEVNLVEQGGFYGWPFFAGRAPAATGSPPAQPVEPITESGDDTWAPAGLAVQEAEGGTTLFVATLRAEVVLRIVLRGDDPRAVDRIELALDGFGRLRAADFGPDGCLYLTTSNTDGRGVPRPGDDRVLRVCPR